MINDLLSEEIIVIFILHRRLVLIFARLQKIKRFAVNSSYMVLSVCVCVCACVRVSVWRVRALPRNLVQHGRQ